uniref:cyclophilin-like fold protein n=1 Tax=uncultured Rhizobium sp. TaxID=155567 RepID=UPI002610156D|nr:cyclophilin-like fold protein [uncultured Rhizobium sp.]
MTTTPTFINRRALIAAGAATLLLPSLAKAQQENEPASQRTTDMKIRMTFDDHTMIATLYDNPSAQDFYTMLPLDLTIEDFSSNEKIVHLPRKLTEEGSGPFGNEQPYDLCYYKPWGNLALFYTEYEHPGLIRLGRFDEGQEALHVRGKYPVRIEPVR